MSMHTKEEDMVPESRNIEESLGAMQSSLDEMVLVISKSGTFLDALSAPLENIGCQLEQTRKFCRELIEKMEKIEKDRQESSARMDEMKEAQTQMQETLEQMSKMIQTLQTAIAIIISNNGCRSKG